MDRMLRANLVRCFERAGRASSARRLGEWPPVVDAEAWRRSLVQLQTLPEVPDGSDTELLAAFCCVRGNLPASILEEPVDTFLRQASAIALILGNFSVGSFETELEAQHEDIVSLRHA